MATHTDMMKNLKASQESDHDGREAAREADYFTSKRDGQWEPSIVSRMSGRPRYTFDQTNAVVDEIMGDIEQAEFSIDIAPAGGQATKEIANTREGIIRNIEYQSGAKYIYSAQVRQALVQGLSGWRVLTKRSINNPFEQDFFIEAINNYKDRCYWDANAEKRDMSDADEVFLLSSLTMDAYLKKWKKGKGVSVGQDKSLSPYYHKKPDEVIVGEHLYRKRQKKTYVRMNTGAVYEVNDDFEKIRDDLSNNRILVEDDISIDTHITYQRFFDGGEYLSGEKKTAFELLPVVPIFMNYSISDDKLIYWGVVEKLMDSQRIKNYTISRQVEETALSPRKKLLMTSEQAEGYTDDYQTMNIDTKPVLFYKHVQNQPPPFETGGPNVNPGLSELSASMDQNLKTIPGQPDVMGGANPGLQSGEALGILKEKGDNTNYKYFQAAEIAICRTGEIIERALPIIYDTRRDVNVINADRSKDTITVNDTIRDEETGELVEVNNLATGRYLTTCSSGPAFQSRQQETINTMLKIAAIDPSIIALGGDVMLNAVDAPAIDQIAERKRAQMVQQGMIPPSQLTDDEKALLQQQQEQQAAQGNQPSAIDQAVLQQAEADAARANAMVQDTLSKINDRTAKTEQATIKLQQEQEKINNDRLKIEQAQQKQVLDALAAVSQELKTNAETMEIIRKAFGPDAIIGPDLPKLFGQQADIVAETQEGIIQQEATGAEIQAVGI